MTPDRWLQVDARLRGAWGDLYRSSERRFHDLDPEMVALMQRFFLRCGPHRVRYPAWLGAGGQQFPADYLAYAEALGGAGSRVLVETGTGAGGTTLFFEECLARRHPDGDYRVVTVDSLPEPAPYISGRPHVRGLIGDSVDTEVADQVRLRIPSGWPVSVTLDSDHDARHVLAELELYAPLVTPGHYLIVQDTFLGLFWGGNLGGQQAEAAVLGGTPRAFDYAGCPLGAVEAWLRVHGDAWTIDEYPTRFWTTQNPYGFLRRIR